MEVLIGNRVRQLVDIVSIESVAEVPHTDECCTITTKTGAIIHCKESYTVILARMRKFNP